MPLEAIIWTFLPKKIDGFPESIITELCPKMQCILKINPRLIKQNMELCQNSGRRFQFEIFSPSFCVEFI